MKKTILPLIIILVSALLVNGQVEKGKVFIHGASNLGINFGKSKIKTDGNTEDDQKYFELEFMPAFGYTVIDNLPVGIFMDVDHYNWKMIDGDDYDKGTSFTVGPFVRYYITNLDGFMPFGEAMIGWGGCKDTYKSPGYEVEYKDCIFAWRLGAGGGYFFNDHVSADMNLFYSHEAYNSKETGEENGRSDDHSYKTIYNSFNILFGITVLLGN